MAATVNCSHRFDDVLKIADDLILAVPCVARYFAMLGGENLESRFLRKAFPQNIAISSIYGFSEICPTFGESNEIHNRSNNASIVMCAF